MVWTWNILHREYIYIYPLFVDHLSGSDLIWRTLTYHSIDWTLDGFIVWWDCWGMVKVRVRTLLQDAYHWGLPSGRLFPFPALCLLSFLSALIRAALAASHPPHCGSLPFLRPQAIDSVIFGLRSPKPRAQIGGSLPWAVFIKVFAIVMKTLTKQTFQPNRSLTWEAVEVLLWPDFTEVSS